MAPKDRKNQKGSLDKGNGKPVSDAPPGFDEVVSSAGRADGWAVKREGAIIQGRLLSRTEMRKADSDGKHRAFYSIELQMVCDAITGKGDDTEQVQLKPGDVVNVDESAALEDLESRTRDGGVYDVWIKYGKQEEGSRGRKGFWPAAVRLKVIREPRREVSRRERDTKRSEREIYDDRENEYQGRPTRDRDD